MRWTPAHALKLRRPAGAQCLRRELLTPADGVIHCSTTIFATKATETITISVVPEKSRNKEVLEVRDSYAIAAVMPRGKPTRGLAKLKRKWVAEIAVRERFDGEPFGPLFEPVWPRARFTLPTHG